MKKGQFGNPVMRSTMRTRPGFAGYPKRKYSPQGREDAKGFDARVWLAMSQPFGLTLSITEAS